MPRHPAFAPFPGTQSPFPPTAPPPGAVPPFPGVQPPAPPPPAPPPPAQVAPIPPGFNKAQPQPASPAQEPGTSVAAPAPSSLNQQTFLASVQGYQPSPDGLRQWYSDIGSQIPGVSFIDHPHEPKLVLADGTIIDTIRGAGAPGSSWHWLVEGVGGIGGQSGAPGGAAVDFSSFFGGREPLPPFGLDLNVEPPSLEDAAFSNEARDQILAALAQAQQPVSIDDPILRDQQQAFERAIERAVERANIENAESLAAQGVAQSGAGEVAREGLQQFFGEQSASNASALVANELNRRRNELSGLLNLAAGLGDADLARQLQRELGETDLQLRGALGERALGLDEQGQGLQEAIARAQLALDESLGRGQLGLGFAGLGQQGAQLQFERGFANDQFNQAILEQIVRDIIAGL